MKQIIFNTYQLGRAILYGTIFMSIWFKDMKISDISDTNTQFSFTIVILCLYFLFGGLFLDGMKNILKYEKFLFLNISEVKE